MKFDKDKSFPHPVLRPFSDDYPEAEFQCSAAFDAGEDGIKFDVSLAMSSNSLFDLINAGKASFAIVISCRDTYYRRTTLLSEEHVEIEASAGDLRGEVLISPYVVAIQSISSYSSEEFHEEYSGLTFDIEAGQVLAQDDPQVLFVDKDVFRPVTSVFKLVRDESLTGGSWVVDLDEDFVNISVSPQMKEVLDGARNDPKNQCILINSIYFGAVTYAIQALKEDAAQFSDRKWAEVMRRQAHNLGESLENKDAYLLAQHLMSNPLRLLSLKCFEDSANV